jgi:hypothetical protein
VLIVTGRRASYASILCILKAAWLVIDEFQDVACS